MVQFPNRATLYPESEAKFAVKLEIDDGEIGSPTRKKRPRSSSPFDQMLGFQDQYWSRILRSDDVGINTGSAAAAAMEEPTPPLGLHLRKSPSLLDLIQMRLSQSASTVLNDDSGLRRRKDAKAAAAGAGGDKLKASNFPASCLRIGTWEWISRNEGDLVAKCYFAKRKLVWEILDGSLKNKIEIQWSDITALKASCPENGSGILDLVLARQPLFFKEMTPQPKKHTLWQVTSDFTSGQASIHRGHHLKCAPGLLSKHIEKLIQCDPHLKALTQQSEIVLDSPYFEPRSPIFENQEQEVAESHRFDHIDGGSDPTSSGFCDASSACSAPSSSPVNDVRDVVGRVGMSSPVSGTDASSVATNHQVERFSDPRSWENLKLPALHPSTSMTDLVNHIGNYFSGKCPTGDQLHPGSTPVNQNMLEENVQHLLVNSQSSLSSNEKLLMNRVDSLCCLLQNPASIQSFQMNSGKHKGDNHAAADGKAPEPSRKVKPVFELAVVEKDGDDRKPSPAISRKESVGELLFHLPHVESLPFILLNEMDHC